MKRVLAVGLVSLLMAGWASPGSEKKDVPPAEPPADWLTVTPRPEIRPAFSWDDKGGPDGQGALVTRPVRGGARAGAGGGGGWRAGGGPRAPRTVRGAAVLSRPRGGRTREDNCRLYEPLIAEAAKQKADLVVLGETLTYYGLGK